MSEISKEEKERLRQIQLEEAKQKLAEEWGENQVKIPKMGYFYINLYQFCIPAIFPIVLTWFFFYITGVFELPIIYKILLFPILICLDYISYIVAMGFFCALVVNRWDKISPPVEGVFQRTFSDGDVEDERLKYYHLRGFLYKWPVFTAKKSFFPWTGNYMLRKIGKNKIHRDAQYLDNFVALEFTNLKEQCFIMYGCTLSSHVVDSLYGNLTIKTVTGEKFATMHPHAIAAPGSTLKQGVNIMGFTMVIKDAVIKNEFTFPYGIKCDYKGVESVVPKSLLDDWENRKLELAKFIEQ